MSRQPTYPREIRIWVGAEQIRSGIRKDGGHCPIGLSLVGRYKSCYISTRYVWVCQNESFYPGPWAWYVLDKNGCEFVEQFDKGMEVKPLVLSMVLVHVYRF